MKLGTSGKIGICWAAVTFGGLYAFYLSKSNIDKKRYELMQVRERIRKSNVGEYEKSYRRFD